MTTELKSTIITDSYTAKSAATITGLSLAMVNYLCRYEMVRPAAGAKRGRGSTRKYSFTDLLLLRIIARLLANGISVLRLKKCLKTMRGRGVNGRDLLTTRYVITDGYDIYFKNDGVLELLESGQYAFAFVLELGTIREEVKASIENKIAIGF